MAYFLTNPLFDIPNIVYVFYIHYTTFKVAQQNFDIVKSDSDSNSCISESEAPAMELLRMAIAINFHELQANDAVFSYEYKKVSLG